MKYRRILLKLSGESLMGDQDYGISPDMLAQYASEIKQAKEEGAEIGVVIGGGNIFRGLQGAAKGMDRVQGDYMGMLATVINSMALQAELEKQGVKTELLGGLAIEPICKESSRARIKQALEEGKVVLIGGGTGNPYFTTDTASSLRAIEMQADAILKGTRVDGIYTADPEKDPNATKYSSLTYEEALNKQLKIMDLTAFALCRENNMPIYVFDMNKKGNLIKVIKGEHIGTIVADNQ
ncbi:MAG: UMP kinase [Bacteroidales bacterium]|jgi:uridylate kinase|nr:UMP kinase [Bacteroidales bacterium]MEE0917265.1 UMP kinase [Bacteroidales bacterium]MEE0962404.1 UMP kinase [Bacteroidales bacterium]MEE0982772.1 UMP kinase [Bacteroidales bacterium]MEE1000333.1 UMP kinase [Bacteroidales bacterium]